MPVCAESGCPNIVERGLCRDHRTAYERTRGTRHQRGYDNRWARYSAARLATDEHCFCVGYPNGVHGTDLVVADVTDHIKSARRYPELFWDESNHQSLCGPCNRKKAIAEEGAFGRHHGPANV